MTPINSMPFEVLRNLSAIAQADMDRYAKLVPHFVALSPEKYIIRDGDLPLLAIGTVRLSLLNPLRELWMYGTRFLQIEHLREFRPMFAEWAASAEGPVMARSDTSAKAKFLRFFGARKVSEEDGIELYEVIA